MTHVTMQAKDCAGGKHNRGNKVFYYYVFVKDEGVILFLPKSTIRQLQVKYVKYLSDIEKNKSMPLLSLTL